MVLNKTLGIESVILNHTHLRYEWAGKQILSDNIVKRSLLSLYRLLQIERGPCSAGIAKTGRQGACELITCGNGR